MTEQFIAGIIGAPFGVKGFVKIKPLSGEIDHLLKLPSATLRQGGKERHLVIEENAVSLPYVLMRFAGYSSPEEAKLLCGAELLVDRKDAAPLQPGEYYIEDLKGIAVAPENSRAETLGHIVSIIEGGSGDLAELRLPDGSVKLVPFRPEFFTSIDIHNKTATLTNLWILE